MRTKQKPKNSITSQMSSKALKRLMRSLPPVIKFKNLKENEFLPKLCLCKMIERLLVLSYQKIYRVAKMTIKKASVPSGYKIIFYPFLSVIKDIITKNFKGNLNG